MSALGSSAAGGTPISRNAAAVLGIPYVLAASAVAVSCDGTTDENTLATITVPANALGPNGFLRISTVWTYTNSANTKTLRVRYSGAAGTIFQTIAATTTVTTGALINILNRGATNSQVGGSGAGFSSSYGMSGSALATGAVDTTAATSIVITGQKASAGETLTLEGYAVEVMYRA